MNGVFRLLDFFYFEGGDLDRNLLTYLSSETNVVQTDGVIFSREKSNNGMELIHVLVNDKEVYSFWNNPYKTKKPKGSTGGKKPYVIIMTQEVEVLRNKKVNGIEEALGLLLVLSPNTEWHTGRLINKRNKNSLKYEELLKISGSTKYKFEKLMKILKDNDLLTHTPEGYFISSKLIKKGKMSKE